MEDFFEKVVNPVTETARDIGWMYVMAEIFGFLAFLGVLFLIVWAVKKR